MSLGSVSTSLMRISARNGALRPKRSQRSAVGPLYRLVAYGNQGQRIGAIFGPETWADVISELQQG